MRSVQKYLDKYWTLLPTGYVAVALYAVGMHSLATNGSLLPLILGTPPAIGTYMLHRNLKKYGHYRDVELTYV